MAIYSLIPTQEIMNLAKANNQLPFEYLNTRPYIFPNNAGFDKRKMDRHGLKYLEDVLITRADGSRFIIHDMQSSIDDLYLYEIKEIDEQNRVINRVLAYMDSLDYSKLQSEPAYLNCLGDSLLSQRRIESKMQIAKRFELEEIYVGFVAKDNSTGEYLETVRDSDVSMLHYIRTAKQSENFNELETLEERRKKEIQAKRRSVMIEAIIARVHTLSDDKLAHYCKELNIPTEKFDFDDTDSR